MRSIEEEIVRFGKWIYEKQLTDIAGGNISVRQGDLIYCTPTGAGQKYMWDLRPEQIISARVDTDELFDNPQHSKESISHLLVYRAYPQVEAIIHAHPFHVMPFCAAEKALPAVIKSAQIYGPQFDIIPETPMYSREQGEEIVKKLQGKEEKMVGFAAGVLMPKHGVFVVSSKLVKAMDCVERMATNAYCLLMQKLID